MSHPSINLEKTSHEKMTEAFDALALSTPSTPTANSTLTPYSNSIKELERALPNSESHGSRSNHGFMRWPAGWSEEMKRSYTRRVIEATFDPSKEENRRFLDGLARQAGRRFVGEGRGGGGGGGGEDVLMNGERRDGEDALMKGEDVDI